MELSDIYRKFKDKAKLFVFKVPYNYNFNNFILKTKVKKMQLYTHQKDGYVKMVYIFVKI